MVLVVYRSIFIQKRTMIVLRRGHRKGWSGSFVVLLGSILIRGCLYKFSESVRLGISDYLLSLTIESRMRSK